MSGTVPDLSICLCPSQVMLYYCSIVCPRCRPDTGHAHSNTTLIKSWCVHPFWLLLSSSLISWLRELYIEVSNCIVRNSFVGCATTLCYHGVASIVCAWVIMTVKDLEILHQSALHCVLASSLSFKLTLKKEECLCGFEQRNGHWHTL